MEAGRDALNRLSVFGWCILIAQSIYSQCYVCELQEKEGMQSLAAQYACSQ